MFAEVKNWTGEDLKMAPRKTLNFPALAAYLISHMPRSCSSFANLTLSTWPVYI